MAGHSKSRPPPRSRNPRTPAIARRPKRQTREGHGEATAPASGSTSPKGSPCSLFNRRGATARARHWPKATDPPTPQPGPSAPFLQQRAPIHPPPDHRHARRRGSPYRPPKETALEAGEDPQGGQPALPRQREPPQGPRSPQPARRAASHPTRPQTAAAAAQPAPRGLAHPLPQTPQSTNDHPSPTTPTRKTPKPKTPKNPAPGGVSQARAAA